MAGKNGRAQENAQELSPLFSINLKKYSDIICMSPPGKNRGSMDGKVPLNNSEAGEIGMREAVILFIKLFLALVFTAMPILALAFLATSIALPIRIGLAVFIVACGLAVAFGRFSFGSENAEEEVTDRPHPMESTQVTRREAGAISRGVMPRGCDITDAPVKPMTPIPPKPSLAAVRRPRTRMEFDATPGYFAGAISLAFLAMLIAWALMGGLNEILGVHTMFH